MPRIPTYQSRINAPGAQRSTRLQPQQEITNLNVPLVQDTTGERTQMIGSALGNAAMVLKQKEDRDGKLRAMEKSSQLEVDFTDFMRQKELEATGSATGFTKKIAEDFDSRYEELIGNASNQAEKLALRESQIRARKTFLSQAQAFEYAKGLEFIQGSLTKTGENFNTQVYQDPNLFGVKSAEFRELIDSQDLPEGTKQKMKDQYINAMGYSAGMRMAEFNPDAVVEQTKQGQELPAWAKALDPKQVQAIRNKALSVNRGNMVSNNEGFKREIDNSIAQMEDGLPPDIRPSIEQFKAAFPKTWEDKYLNFKTAEQFQDAFFNIQQLSPVETESYIESFKPKKGDVNYAKKQEYFTKLENAAQDKARMIDENPVGLVSRFDPKSEELERAWLTAPEGNQKAIAFQQYAQRMKGQQAYLGRTDAKLLTPKIEESLIQQGNSLLEKNPPEYLLHLDRLKLQSGDYWPQVFKQISSNPSFPDVGKILTSISDVNARTALAQYDSISTNEIFKDNKDQRQTIAKAIQSSESFQNFAMSLNSQANGPQVEQVYRKYIERYAGILAIQNKGSNTWYDSFTAGNEGVEKAIESMIDKDYAFTQFKTNPALRIPRKFEKNTMGQLQPMIDKILSDGVSLFTDNFSVYDKEKLKEFTKEQALKSSTWVPVSGEKGLQLVIRTDAGVYKPLRDKEGNKIVKSWDDFNTLRLNKRKSYRKEAEEYMQQIYREEISGSRYGLE